MSCAPCSRPVHHHRLGPSVVQWREESCLRSRPMGALAISSQRSPPNVSPTDHSKTDVPSKQPIPKALRDSVQRSIAASNSVLGDWDMLSEFAGDPKEYQRLRWSRNSLLTRAKLASAVGKAQLHCTRCEHQWHDSSVEVFFDLGRLGAPRVVRKQCFNCGHLVVPSFSCIEWDRLASEALGKWSKKALEAHRRQRDGLPGSQHTSVTVSDPITKNTVLYSVDVVNNNAL
ncbi:hypothetical protein IscW_ISCW006086 [Ixodes scapularis]|uniref:Zinc-binding domain-containing protein n=1 Tax=Ixodes scapularis TaxID=6945 RepID=B7PP61_IXOSC|nr:hypothetical protein IscW_ISCW006086 [Ixodes scapularis]|eukprot:XP_002435553.1 hypothetical protein IscW_ISCW006086 [Ixodes scapularis]